MTGGGPKQPPPPPIPQRANGCVTQTDATQPPPPDAENDSCNSNNSRKQNTGVQLVQRQQATSPQQNQRVPDIAAGVAKSPIVPTSHEQATLSSKKHQTPDSNHHNHQTTMLASCEPVTPPVASSKMRLKRIKAKYERQSHLSYTKLRELRQLTKTSKTRLRKQSSSGESRHHGNGVKVQGRHERHSPEILVSRDGNMTRGSRHNNHIPRRHLSQTPQVTSSTRDNEAGVTHVAETLEIPRGKRPTHFVYSVIGT